MKAFIFKYGGYFLGVVLFFQLFSLSLRAATVTWIGGSGDWNTATNWSTGALPGTNDDVVIGPGSSITVTHSSGAHFVHSIQSQQAFTLSGGSLTVSNTVQINNTFILSGGTLIGTTVLQPTNGSSLIVDGNIGGTLNGVTVDGTLDVGNTYNGANLAVTNGLTLNGTLLVGNVASTSLYGAVSFYGSQTLGGNGTVIFGEQTTYTDDALRLLIAGTTLTIGPGITIEGKNGVIGYSSTWTGTQNVNVINQGTVSQTVSGGTIAFNGASVLNQGILSSASGGGFYVYANLTNSGTFNVTNSAALLGGTLTLANLGTFNASNATVYLYGVFENTNTTLSVNALGGTWVMDGGEINGGTVLATNGSTLIVDGNIGGTLNGVTMDGTLDVGNTYNGANLAVTNGLTLNGTLLVGNVANASLYGAVSFYGSQTLGGNGTVIFGEQTTYNDDALRLLIAGTTLTIGPGITIEGKNGVIGYSSTWGGTASVSVINEGTVSQTVSGGTVALDGTWVLNQGVLSSLGGGGLDVWASLTNSGTFYATNSAVTLAGTFTLANLGMFEASNATVYLNGILDNSNTTLVVNALGGTWVINEGEIEGGTVVATNGSSLIVYGDSGSVSGTLNGVTVDGTLDVGNTYNTANLAVTNGLTLNGTLLVGNVANASFYGAVSFYGSQTLGGNGTVIFGEQTSYTDDALRLLIAGTTLTIGPGITIEGKNGVIGYSSTWGGTASVSVINEGTVSQTVGGGTVALNGTWVLNQGVLSSLGGGGLDVWASLTNSGTFYATNSAVTLAGTMTLANLGMFEASNATVYLNGILNNSNTTLVVNALGGTWVINEGEIEGGTVVATNGSSLIVYGDSGSVSGTLNGVTVDGTLDVGNTYNTANLAVTNGLTLNGTLLVGNVANASLYGAVSFYGSQTLGGNGTVIFGEQTTYTDDALRETVAGATLTIGPGITIEGKNGVIGYSSTWGGTASVSVINEGTVSQTVSGGTMALTGTSVLNQGSLSSLGGGTLSVIPTSFTNQSSLTAMQGIVALNAGFAASDGTVTVGLNSSSSYGQIQISGAATLGSTLNVVLDGGFVPAISNSFAVVTYGSYSGNFSPLNLPSSPAWQVNYGATALTLLVSDINKLAFTSSPISTYAGGILPSVVVQVTDSATGNPVAASGVPITLSLASGTGVLSGTLTRNTDSTGKATFNDLSLSLVGAKTLIATAIPNGFTPVISGSFTISFGPAAQLAITRTFSSSQQSGVVFTPGAIVQVQDQFGNVVSNSTAAITASSSSTGSGALSGTLSVNGLGTTGSVTFTNLHYNLASVTTPESVVVTFRSPGLVPVSTQPIAVNFYFGPFTLTNGNSVVQIDPTTEDGIFSWTVDGIDQLFQKWFWLRQGTSVAQTSIDNFGPPVGLSPLSSSNAIVTYYAQGLQINLGFTLSGGAIGSESSLLNETITVQNITNAPATVNFYEYSDFDLAGQTEGDSVSFPATNTVVQQGKGMISTESVLGMAPEFWEASWYAITLDKLDGNSPLNLSDSIIPNLPGDQTYTYQWGATLNPGQNFIISLPNNIQPAPVQLTIAPSNFNAVISWTTNISANAQLQSTTNLVQGPWINVTNQPSVVNASYQLSIPQTPGSKFYRLLQ